MTRRLTHALAAVYALVACGLLRCAVISHQHGSLVYTAFFTAAAACLATAIAHHAYHCDELRAARVALERATTLHGVASAEDGVIRVALAAACCETWWATAGADHDPATCARKDQTT